MSEEKNCSDEKVCCCVCLTEVPLSVAQSVEGVDYVYNFCGSDCHEKWRNKKKCEHEDSSK